VKRKAGWFIGAGLVVAIVLAGVVSNFASSSPDGLDAAALQGCTVNEAGEITGGTCIAQQEQDHQLADGPLAEYGIKGIDNPYLSTGLSGVIGVLATFAIGGAIFWLVRRRGGASDNAGSDKATSDNATSDNATSGDSVHSGRSEGGV
jgi:cobalt/nickel transport protein